MPETTPQPPLSQERIPKDHLADPAWAWAPYTPDAAHPWNLPRAGHLYRRAAFGASWSQLQQALSDGPQRTIDRLFQPDTDVKSFNRTADSDEETAGGSAEEFRAWWLRRMLDTPQPLLEKMTLFWHDHFAISHAKVKNITLLRHHVQTLRHEALGHFPALLESVTQSPAVFISLEAQANRKANPNPNLPRTLFEQFTLGPGHFSENDIHEAARALAGWFVFGDELRFVPREQDPGKKTILGQEGSFTAQDLVRIPLANPATSRRIVRKLYRWLISEIAEPSDTMVDPLAEAFARDYDMARVVGRMLRSNLFFSPLAYRARIKSPIEFALGLVKALEGTVGTSRLGADLAALGQDLCAPPTSKGWVGGRSWINRFTLLGRSRLAWDMLSNPNAYGQALDPLKAAQRHGPTTFPSATGFLAELLLQGDLPETVQAGLAELHPEPLPEDQRSNQLRQVASVIAGLPEFHLA